MSLVVLVVKLMDSGGQEAIGKCTAVCRGKALIGIGETL